VQQEGALVQQPGALVLLLPLLVLLVLVLVHVAWEPRKQNPLVHWWNRLWGRAP